MKLYLAGPMRGLPEYNFPAFNAARERLRAQGHEVWCPAENDVTVDGFDGSGEPGTLEYRHYMLRDLPAVLDADAVAVLPEWERSKGATLEVHVARECGIPVLDALTLKPVASSPVAASTPNFEDVRDAVLQVLRSYSAIRTGFDSGALVNVASHITASIEHGVVAASTGSDTPSDAQKLAEAIVWALGYTYFREKRPGDGAYWWRKELRVRASCQTFDDAITAADAASRAIPETSTEEETR